MRNTLSSITNTNTKLLKSNLHILFQMISHRLVYRVLLVFIISSCSFLSLKSQTSISVMKNRLKSAKGIDKYELLYDITKSYLLTSERKSINYGKQTLAVAHQLKNKELEANSLNLLGTAYLQKKDYRQAIKSFEAEYAIRKEQKRTGGGYTTLYNIGLVYKEWGKESKAIPIYQEVLEKAKKNENPALVFECYESIIEMLKAKRDYKKAFDMFENYMAYKNKLVIGSKDKKLKILETKLVEDKVQIKKTKQQVETLVTDTATKSAKISNLVDETTEQKVTISEQQEENRRQRLWLIAFVSFFCVILIFSFALYIQVQAKKRANLLLTEKNAQIQEQNEEIALQAELLHVKNVQLKDSHEEVSAQAEQLEHANKELHFQNEQITQSILYASRIQNAMLPQKESLDEVLPENMIFFKPRDIVSGDFYWFRKFENRIFLAAVDCTGHGVPGAFMSMLGISFLDTIVRKNNNIKPNEILEALRRKIKRTLNQTGKDYENTDGMDMSLCILDTDSSTMQFAGAHNPLYLVRNNELQIYKADKQPVGYFFREVDFTNNEINVQKDDCIYLFSDGYIDQFGGENNKRFKSKSFKDLLLAIHQKPMKEQSMILERTINDWRQNFSQTDDILVMGVRV